MIFTPPDNFAHLSDQQLAAHLRDAVTACDEARRQRDAAGLDPDDLTAAVGLLDYRNGLQLEVLRRLHAGTWPDVLRCERCQAPLERIETTGCSVWKECTHCFA